MTDYLLVNRDGTTSQFDMANTAKLQDDDLLLVNRSDTTYTVTGKEIKDSAREPIAPVINSVTLTQNQTNTNRFTNKSFTSTINEEGEAYPTAVASISAKVTGALSVESSTLPITANTYNGSGAIPLELSGTTNLGDLFKVDTEVQASASYTPVSSEIVGVETKTLSDYAGFDPGYTVHGTSEDQITTFYVGPYGKPGLNNRIVWGNGGNVPDPGSARNYKWDFTAFGLVNDGSGITVSLDFLLVAGGGWSQSNTTLGSDAGNIITASDPGGALTDSTPVTWTRLTFTLPAGATFLTFGQSWNQAGSGGTGGLNGAFCNVNWGGQNIVFTDGQPILEFTDETDLKYFQEGDVVQGGDVILTELGDIQSVDVSSILNGTDITSITLTRTLGPNGGLALAGIEVNGVAITGQSYVDGWEAGIVWEGSGTGDKAFNGNFSAGNWAMPVSADQPTGNGIAKWTGNIPNTGTVIMYVYGQAKPAPNQNIRINGVTVVSTDPDNNKMVVSGGEWGGVNASQDWSANGTGSVGLPWSNVFDGSTSTFGGNPNVSATAEVSFNAIENVTKLEIFVQVPAGGPSVITLNEGLVNISAAFNGLTVTPQWVDVSSYLPASSYKFSGLSNVRTTQNYVNMYAIRVNGKTLVNGPWDQSQNWSKADTRSLFDGELSSTWFIQGAEGWVTVSDADFTINSSVEIYSNDAGTPTSLRFGGTQVNVNTGPDSIYGWRTVDITPLTGSGPFSGLELIWPYGSSSNGYGGIRIDGKILVDLGIGADTEVTGPLKRGNGTIKSITGADVEIEPFTDNAFVEGQNLISTDPIKVTPVTDAIDSTNGNTITFDSATQLLNFANGDPVTMCNSDGTPASVTYESSEIIDVSSGYDISVNDVNYTQSELVLNGGPTANTEVPGNNFFDDWETKYGSLVIKWNVAATYYFDPPLTGGNFELYTFSSGYNTGQLYFRLEDGTEIMVDSTVLSSSNSPNWVSLPATITSIKAFTCGPQTGEDLICGAIRSNGKLITNGTFLTFEDGTDLNKFPVGTVVQPGNGADLISAVAVDSDGNSQVVSQSILSEIVEGWNENFVNHTSDPGQFYSTMLGDGTFGRGGGTKMRFSLVAPSTINLYGGRITSQDVYMKATVFDKDGTIVKSFPSDLWSQLNVYDLSDLSGEVEFEIEMQNSNYGFYINVSASYYPTSSDLSFVLRTPVTVTDDSDIGNNKLTVSGGEWGGYNTSQVWSDSVTGTVESWSSPISSMFAGRIETTVPEEYVTPVAGTSLVFSTSSFPTAKSVKIYYMRWNASAPDSSFIVVNGVSINSPHSTATGNDLSVESITVDVTGTGLQSVEWKAVTYNTNYVSMVGIEIDGKLLVNGPWNQSKVWSNDVSADLAFFSTNTPDKAFNGEVGTNLAVAGYFCSCLTGSANTITVDTSLWSLGSASKLEVVAQAYTADASFTTPFVNGNVAPDSFTDVANNFRKFVWDSILPTAITVKSEDTNTSPALSAIFWNGDLLVDKGIGGDTELSITQSGTGTVSTVDAPNNQITLTGSNNQWVVDYHMTTPEKNAVEKTAYLVLDGLANVTGISAFPQAATPVTANNPVITFPATFDTGNAPDVELPYPTFLQTTVTLTNVLGSDSKDSNELYPLATSGFVAPVAGSTSTLVSEYGDFVSKIISYGGRAATLKASQYTDTVAADATAAETEANDYLANNP